MNTRIDVAVEAYKRKHRPRLTAQLDHFARQLSLKAAILDAGMARNAKGKRFRHQSRLRKNALEECTERLLARQTALAGAKSFDDIHDIVESAIREISGIGELMVYDTALRLGAKLGRLPTSSVYLHSGTRKGAKALGLDRGQRVLEMSELPAAFHSLEPYEVEDCLCIFKDHFAPKANASTTDVRVRDV